MEQHEDANGEKNAREPEQESSVQKDEALEPANEDSTASTGVVSLNRELARIENKLREKQTKVEDAEKARLGATNEQRMAEARRRLLEEEKNALQQLIGQLRSSESNLARRREAVEAGWKDAESFLDKDLGAGLSEVYRKHIDEAIVAENQKIDDGKAKVGTIAEKLQAAERQLADAKRELSNAEGGLRRAQAELQQLDARIQTTSAEVSRLLKASQTAKENGQAGDAFYLARELENALDLLEQVSNPEREENLLDEVANQWQKAEAARAQVQQANEELNQHKTELREAESALQKAEKERTANIQKKLRDFPEKDKRSHTEVVTARTV